MDNRFNNVGFASNKLDFRDPYRSNQIVTQARVVQNVFADIDELNSRRKKTYTPKYGGHVSLNTFSIGRGDLLVKYTNKKKDNNYVFASLNGAFDNNTPDSLLYSILTFAGFAMGEIIFPDEKSVEQKSNDIAAQIGGSTTIINTSSRPLSPGDFICWKLPSANQALPIYPANSGRVIFPIDKYEAKDCEITTAVLELRRAAIKEGRDLDEVSETADGFVMQNVVEFEKQIKLIMLAGINVALRSRLVRVNDNIDLESDTLGEDLNNIPQADNTSTDEFTLKLSRHLGLVEGSLLESEGSPFDIPIPTDVNTGSLRSHFMNYIFNVYGKSKMVYGSQLVGRDEPIDQEYINGLFKNLFPNLNKVIFHYAEQKKSTIVGRVVSGALPGNEIDILITRPSGNF